MNEHLSNFLFGVLGGGIVATAFRLAETYWLAPRFSESTEARKKLYRYARPLSHACHELEYRLRALLPKMQEEMNDTRRALGLAPGQAKSIDWFTKEGYYITSTAYLLALVSSWIQLYESDVVFLKFGRSSLTKQFFDLIEDFKNILSSDGSILWFHYVNGVGELLIAADGDRPMTLSEFIYKLYTDELFRDYYDQLFVFFNQIAMGKFLPNLEAAIQKLSEIKHFLVQNQITIAMR